MELASLSQSGGKVEFGRVTKRLREKDGLPIGTAHNDPILDTRVYEVEFPDGHKASLSANAIAENLFAQVDDEGNRHVDEGCIRDNVPGNETQKGDNPGLRAILQMERR